MRTEQKTLREKLAKGNRYQFERELMTNGTGNTCLCMDLYRGGTRVVIKTLGSVESVSVPISNSSREFSLLRRISHPNLARLMEFGVLEDTKELFCVHEWIEGKNLFDGTDGEDADGILSLVLELSKALQYLHTRGIVHANLKPENAILSGSGNGRGRLKIMDFGVPNLSRHLQLRRGSTALAYTAPEVLLGNRATRNSDLYSLGVLIYQLLARRLPFDDEDPGFLVQKHLQSSVDLRPIERIRGGKHLSLLLRRLLEKDPLKRPVPGEEIIRSIEEALGRNSVEMDLKELESRFSASQFVGREREMSHLQRRAAQVLESGRGWTVFITGEAGLGKTRCMDELGSWALLEGWRVVEGNCGSREEGSYGPYRQIFANTEYAEGEAIFHFKEATHHQTPGLFESSSQYAAGQFRDLLTRELVRRIGDRPTILLLHDFHLADEATNAVLDYLSSDVQAHSVLICVSLRSGEEFKGTIERVMESAIRQERGEVLALEPLSKESVEQLIEGMTEESRLKWTLGTWIFKSFGGNPFFLEEILKHLVEQKILRHELGIWRFIDEDLAKLELPASVGAVLQRRLSQLSPRARELANWLALFQGAISKSLLSAVASMSPSAVVDALLELSNRQMIRVEAKGTEESLEFRHSLIAETVRGGLPRKMRQRMHRTIAEVLERECGTKAHVQELAMHFMEGNSGEIAVRYALTSAAQARAEFAHEHAHRCFEYIFKCRRGLTEEQLCMAAIEASDTMFALGLPKRSIRLLKTELKRNKSIGAELKARMYMQLGLSFKHSGDLQMLEICCKTGLMLFRKGSASNPNITKAMLWAELAFAAILGSRFKRGLTCLDKARKAIPTHNSSGLEGRIEVLSAALYLIARNLHTALSASERAACILYNSEESHLVCSAYSMIGTILAVLGRFPLALEKHTQAISLSDKSRSVVLKSQALGNLAECLCRMGRLSEAGNIAERAIKFVSESSNPSISFAFNSTLAEIKLAGFDYRGAYQIVKILDRDAKNIQAIYMVGHALYVAASLNYQLGNFATALVHIEKLLSMQTHDVRFYESELAEALKARIISELGSAHKALAQLYILDRMVTRRHWPYQMCIIKLHISEILLKEDNLGMAEHYAKNALRLANAMQATTLICHSHLLLGLIYSPLQNQHSLTKSVKCETTICDNNLSHQKAIQELKQACNNLDSTFVSDTTWRAHTELCLIMKMLQRPNDYLEHAQKAYEHLCKIEEQVPSEMLPGYCNAFNRSRTKAELACLIQSGRADELNEGVTVANIRDDEKTRILLHISATASSVRELSPLLESILDQLIQAINVERALVFLKDELTAKLQLAKGRNGEQITLADIPHLDHGIIENVLNQGKPIVSANAQSDPRLSNTEIVIPTATGKILCAPLKVAGRVIGVLYADHPLPAVSLSESTISLFAAFCNIAAIAIDNALAHQHLVREKTELEQYLHQVREPYAEIIGKSASIELLRDKIGLAAASPLDILISGESGSGKELVARAIYRTGRRKGGRFVAVDCGSLTDSLAEAELFGFRKGAFTGASENRLGLLEAAHEGIIFLDEISNLPLHLQAKLLRVIQEREVRRIGETVPRKIDIQVLAATNKDLLEEMRKRQFRQDLFYRLKAFEIRVPPLRDRLDDIPLLIEWFLEKTSKQEGGRSKRFLPDALELLRRYSYPGNIRELRNIVIGAYYSTVKTIITVEDLPPEVLCNEARANVSEFIKAEDLYKMILDGKGNFEGLVRRPFLQRHFGSSLVRGVVQIALKDCRGKYRDALLRLRVPEKRYSATMQFLKHYKCYLDFRPFRRGSNEAFI